MLTGYLIYDYLVKVERSMSNVTYGEVIVAAVDVPAKTLLEGEMLKVQKVPVEYIHPLAVRNRDELVGRITVAPLVGGEQILAKKIAKEGEPRYGLSYLVPVGKRAVTVLVDEVSGIAGLIKPGDSVDVAAVVNLPDSMQQREVPHALVVLQDVEVLAVGRVMAEGGNQNALEYDTVTLAVTVEQSRPLILANQKGNIRLMLRSPVDDGIVQTRPFGAEDYVH